MARRKVEKVLHMGSKIPERRIAMPAGVAPPQGRARPAVKLSKGKF